MDTLSRVKALPCLYVGLLVAAGCGAQATPDYPGEKLSVVKGKVVSALTVPEVPDALVLANWGDVGAMFPPGGTTAEVEGEFPAQFSLALYEPPPEEKLFNPADSIRFAQDERPFDPAVESRIALAHIVAVAKDASGNPDPYHVLGAAEGHALLYVEEDIAEDSLGAAMFHAPLEAGYHLLEVRAIPEAEERGVIECEAAAVSVEAWKACGLNSRLHRADNDDTVTVRLVPDTELFFESYSPIYVSPGTDLDPTPTCNPMDPMNPCM
jgi:hypothetical protein